MLAAIEIPENAQWVYYVLSGLFFTVCGMMCGYFIWRKGYMQTLDAELEVRRTDDELKNLRHDLSIEEEELSPAAVQNKAAG